MYYEILFFFSAIGVFNTLLIAIYLLIKQKAFNYSFLIGIFLLLIGSRTGVACIYFFYHQLPPIFLQIGLVANLLAGVCVFILMNSSSQIAKKELIHLITATSILVLFGIAYPFSRHFYIWDNIIRYILHSILTIYLILAWVKALQVYKAKVDEHFPLKMLVLVAFTLICISFSISLFNTYVLGPILYSCLFYIFSFLIYKTLRNTPNDSREKYQNKKIESEAANQLIAKINQKVSEDKLFKKQNLKVNELATLIEIPSHQLTQVLNDNLGISFSSYINNFRVEEAKQLLLSEKMLTIEAIGQEAGFSSKTTFFKVFKAQTGQTPKTFVKNSTTFKNGTD